MDRKEKLERLERLDRILIRQYMKKEMRESGVEFQKREQLKQKIKQRMEEISDKAKQSTEEIEEQVDTILSNFDRIFDEVYAEEIKNKLQTEQKRQLQSKEDELKDIIRKCKTHMRKRTTIEWEAKTDNTTKG